MSSFWKLLSFDVVIALMGLLFLTLPTLTTAQNADTVVLNRGVRSLDISPNGTLAFSLLGDLWMRETKADAPAAVRLTSGTVWDRNPTWGPEGEVLYFSSNRAGQVDLWSVERRSDGSFGSPQRITDTPDRAERSPAVSSERSLVFRAGRGRQANLWVRGPDGEERQLTDTIGAEKSPSFSPDGRHVVFVAVREAGRSLRVLSLESDERKSRVIRKGPFENPVWGPEGELIAFGIREASGEVAVTDTTGRFRNRVASLRAEIDWAPDGTSIVGAELPRPGPQYNGDPDRLGSRGEGEMFPRKGGLHRINLGVRPSTATSKLSFRASLDRTAYNRRVYDRVANRMERLYYDDTASPGLRQEWEQVREQSRMSALDAETRDELERAVHSLLTKRPPTQTPDSGRAAVSSAHPRATEAGLEILRKGGNVVDAAVALSFAVGVVEPDASGVGGYGQMLISLEGMDQPTAIEFLTRVPQAATLDNGALTDSKGNIPRHGPQVINIPGTVAGMEKAWKKYGSGELSWEALLAPAIRLAEDGFILDEVLPTTLRRREEELRQYKGTRELFFEDGQLLQPGDTLRNPDLAWTLRQIAKDGAEAFYEGAVAKRIVEDLHGKGNAMVKRDLARYWAAEREPMKGTYRGHTIYGSAPATTGGATLVSKLQLLDQYGRASPKAYSENAYLLHAMIEAWKLTPETSGRIADPGLWPVRRAPFESRDTARSRWNCFESKRAITSVVDADDHSAKSSAVQCAPGLNVRRASASTSCTTGDCRQMWGQDPTGRTGSLSAPTDDGESSPVSPHTPLLDGTREGKGTTGFAVADAEGNMVTVTQTLGTWGGSFYVTPGLGFLYNDKLGSYRSDPDKYNARLPFARNATSISPTLVFEGENENRKPLLATAAGGNAWITSAIYQIVTGVINRGLGPQQALEQPRFLVGDAPVEGGKEQALVQYEEFSSPHVIDELRSRGHRLQPISLRGELRLGFAAAVKVLPTKEVVAGGDPRRAGSGKAIK